MEDCQHIYQFIAILFWTLPVDWGITDMSYSTETIWWTNDSLVSHCSKHRGFDSNCRH
jgi:hypothetical protein